jgi:hypothetical protein
MQYEFSMSCASTPPPSLTDEQKGRICGILSVGCDRQTAADFVGCSLGDVRRALQCDGDFLANVRRAEAGVELSHMRNVQQAAQDKKDWKASIWWLECRSPERFARRSGTVTVPQLKAFVAILIDTLASEVSNIEDRQRVLARMRQISESVEQLLRDARADVVDLTATAIDLAATAGENEPAKLAVANLLASYDEDSP